MPYLLGGALSWLLVAWSARLPFLALLLVLLGGAATAVALVLGAMLLGSLSAATGQGALALHARSAAAEPDRPTAIGLFTLCYLLGAAFGPAIAALATA